MVNRPKSPPLSPRKVAIRDLADRLARAQPLLASLAADMSLRGLLDVLTLAIAAGEEDMSGLDPGLAEIGAALRARSAGRPPPTARSVRLPAESAAASDGASGRLRPTA